jgi:hypothetical protein
MNMAYNLDSDRNFEYRNEEEPAAREKIQAKKNRPNYARKRGPAAFNGIHRRRNKRFSW